MIIERNRRKVEVPDNFLDQDYRFGVVRFRRIKELSGLSYSEFAKAHDFKIATVLGWAGYRKKGKNNNPLPHFRVRLAEIEADLKTLKRGGVSGTVSLIRLRFATKEAKLVLKVQGKKKVA